MSMLFSTIPSATENLPLRYPNVLCKTPSHMVTSYHLAVSLCLAVSLFLCIVSLVAYSRSTHMSPQKAYFHPATAHYNRRRHGVRTSWKSTRSNLHKPRVMWQEGANAAPPQLVYIILSPIVLRLSYTTFSAHSDC